MQVFSKKIITGFCVTIFAFALIVPGAVFAAVTPDLGAAASYGILSDTFTNPTGPTTVTGDVGYTTPPAVAALGVHANVGSGAPYSSAGTAQAAALSALGSGANASCDFSFAPGAIDLSTDITHSPAHGTTAVFTPGVYCIDGAVSVSGPLTLSGAGTYIFRSTGALNTTAGSIITLSGASACDVFWTPNGDTTINAGSTFVGTVIPVAQDITVYGSPATSWVGRALTFLHTVTTPTANVNITVPTCLASINVVKTVVNDNGRTNVVSDFPLFVNGTPVVSGATNVFPAGAATVTETSNSNYSASFSGDCDASGHVTLVSGATKFCVITNNDNTPASGGGGTYTPTVPPLISVVKVPSPLALPSGPGPVQYTYTVKNIGTVPMYNVTLVGDTCSPIVLQTGDTNGDNALDLDETWIYTCTTTLAATHTNTVVATGWANGISATDIASATVIVGLPLVPPLIHITKVPSPLALMAGGGMVTYTNKVTNPGTVALSDVQVTDDKCGPVNYVSGDANNNNKLDTNETWTYVCQRSLAQTTTNTATATGNANGFTAKDFAIATVVVAPIPTLPNTGFPPEGNSVWYLIAIAGGAVLGSASAVLVLKRKVK